MGNVLRVSQRVGTLIGQNPSVGSTSLWLLAHCAQNIQTGPFPWVGMRLQCMGNAFKGVSKGWNPHRSKSIRGKACDFWPIMSKIFKQGPFPWVGMRFQCMGNVPRVSQRVGLRFIGCEQSVQNPSVGSMSLWLLGSTHYVLKIFIHGPSLEWAWGFNAWEMFLGCLKGLETSSVKIHPWEVWACDFWPIMLKIFIQGPSLEWAWGFNAWEMFLGCLKGLETSSVKIHPWEVWACDFWPIVLKIFIHGPSLEWAWGFNAWEVFLGCLKGLEPSSVKIHPWEVRACDFWPIVLKIFIHGPFPWVGMRFQCMGNV